MMGGTVEEAVDVKRGEAGEVGASHAPLPRLVFLDGLRGLAALMVVVYHYWLACDSPRWLVSPRSGHSVDLLSPIGLLGGTRVSLFFVLSGFLLYLPFARRRLQTKTGNPTSTSQATERYGAWLWRRLRRLGPAYYAVIAFALMPSVGIDFLHEFLRFAIKHTRFHPIYIGSAFRSFPECLFFLHGMVPGKETPIWDGPIWTLTPEVQLYLAFPLLIALSQVTIRVGGRRWGGVGMTVLLAVVASIGYRVYLYRQIGCALPSEGGGDLFSPYHCLVNTFLGRWAEFALGMGAAEWITQGRKLAPRVAYAVCACDIAALVWFVILRSNLVVGGWVGQVFLASDPLPSPLADAMGGVTFSLMIVCCASLPALARFFTWRPLVWIGTISYSLYLVHVPVLLWQGKVLLYLQRHYPNAVLHAPSDMLVFTLNLAALLPLAILVARIFWGVFERPFLSGNRLKKIGT